MDSGCVICYGSHASSDCPERGEQHCPDCHALILEVVDHTSVCAQKGWVFKKYANLYAKPLKERLIISTSSPFRYLKNACWQKPEDQLELYSPGNGAFIQFKSSHDISLSTTRFEPIRIVVVVKQKEGNAETFAESCCCTQHKSQSLLHLLWTTVLIETLPRHPNAMYHCIWRYHQKIGQSSHSTCSHQSDQHGPILCVLMKMIRCLSFQVLQNWMGHLLRTMPINTMMQFIHN